MRIVSISGLLLGVVRTVAGQNLGVPTTWVNTAVTDTLAIRNGYANDTAQALVSHIASSGSLSDESDGQALAALYTTLAMQDWLSGNKTWETAVTKNLQTWVGQNDIYGNGTKGSERTNTNGLQWGLASYYAYKAYKQTSFLSLAQDVWDTAFTDFISADAVAAPPKGKLPSPRNITWLNATGCLDKFNVAGGVFWLPDVSDNAQIQQDTVGSFATLAGNLYEATQNTTYKTVGLQTVSFMVNTMQNVTSKLQYGVFDIQACQVYARQSPGFQGWYLLPLSIWANITSDPKLFTLLKQTVSTTVLSSQWTDQTSGVLKDPDTDVSDNVWDDKAILVRALSEVLRRFPNSTDLSPFIQAFLAVQYNGLITNARSGSNYSISLLGPAPSTYNSDGNIVALDVLNAASGLPQGTATSTSTSTTSLQTPQITFPAGSTATSVVFISGTQTASNSTATSSSTSTSSSLPVRPIIGGTVGGLPFISVLVCAAWWYCCTHQDGVTTFEEAEKQKHCRQRSLVL